MKIEIEVPDEMYARILGHAAVSEISESALREYMQESAIGFWKDVLVNAREFAYIVDPDDLQAALRIARELSLRITDECSTPVVVEFGDYEAKFFRGSETSDEETETRMRLHQQHVRNNRKN